MQFSVCSSVLLQGEWGESQRMLLPGCSNATLLGASSKSAAKSLESSLSTDAFCIAAVEALKVNVRPSDNLLCLKSLGSTSICINILTVLQYRSRMQRGSHLRELIPLKSSFGRAGALFKEVSCLTILLDSRLANGVLQDRLYEVI